jgi:pimeloyl-ACP methyl ester carboxylesterase
MSAQQELFAMTSTVSAQNTGSSPAETGHTLVNGVNYYHEIHGSGEPVLLLHGGLGSIDMFAPVLPAFAKARTVIAVDLHGHGRTSLGDRAIRVQDMADDMAGILGHLDCDTVDVVGYSLGGGVALHLAARHPERVRRLVIISAGYSQDGFHPEMLPQQAQVSGAMADMMKDTPMYKSYIAVAPRPQDFPELLDRVGEFMRTPFDFEEDVKKIEAQTLLVFGDADMFRLEHVVQFYKLLGGAQQDAGFMREHMARNRLAILPDVTHYETFMSPSMTAAVLPFINGVNNAPSWANQVDAKN